MTGLIRTGNLKLVCCFLLYLAWWVVGFNPVRQFRGARSGWLLILAVIAAVFALMDILSGITLAGALVPGAAIIAIGVVSYVALAYVTSVRMGRPLTTELIIIVLWSTIAALEVNTLVAEGAIPQPTGWLLLACLLVCVAISLVCYQLFYGLGGTAAFVDGTIPLMLAMASCALIACLATP